MQHAFISKAGILDVSSMPGAEQAESNKHGLRVLPCVHACTFAEAHTGACKHARLGLCSSMWRPQQSPHK